MEWISTKGMTHDTAPKGKVLVHYLAPFFGQWTSKVEAGYYDNPNDYKDGENEDYDEGRGWLLWLGDRPVNVVAYMELPKPAETPYTDMSQVEFINQLGSARPNYGSVGT